MLCSKCNQPMVDPDDGRRINSQHPYSGRMCLDCKEAIAEHHTPTAELDVWEYINRRGVPSRLRDAAYIRMESRQ